MHSDWRQNEWIKLIINNILQQNAIYWYGCQASRISSEAKTNSQSGMPHPFPFGNQSTHKKEYYYKERKGGERDKEKIKCLEFIIVNQHSIYVYIQRASDEIWAWRDGMWKILNSVWFGCTYASRFYGWFVRFNSTIAPLSIFFFVII